MAASFPDNVNPGLFLPTTEIFDVGDLQAAGVSSQRFKELLVRLSQASNDSNIVVNKKISGLYVEEEFVDGSLWFASPALTSTTPQVPEQRQEFRKVINFGALPNAATTSVAHGITVDGNTTFTHIYGTASDVGASKEYIPLPFVDVAGTVAAGNVELHVDDTNINITTTGDGTNFTVCYVVLEYIKN